MVGLIIATSILGTLLVSAIVIGAIKMYKMNKNLTALAQCLLTHLSTPDDIDVIDTYSTVQTDWTFPNSEGF